MTWTNPEGSKAAGYVSAQDRRDCCARCNYSEARGDGDGAYLHCLTLQRRVAKLSLCNEWAPVSVRSKEPATC